jgi:hypothetical protein
MNKMFDVAELELNEIEKAETRAKKKGKKPVAITKTAKVAYIRQDNFTVAVVKSGNKLLVGVTKRNPCDTGNPFRAETIALTRAAVAPPIEL